MDELYLDNIDEFVNDQNKIVTYKWLSLTLGVHVNTAKQMLYHYLDHKRSEGSSQLHATYLVSGKFVNNGQTSHSVSVVREEQLEDHKAKMSLIVSVHVYSVQKALLKDSSPLYCVDYDAVKDSLKNCNRHSAIRYPSAVPMSSLELQQKRESQQVAAPEPTMKRSSMNGEANMVSKPSTKPQKGIMGMFGNKPASKTHDTSKDVKQEQKEETPTAVSPKSKPAAKVNPVMNFFGTQAAKKPNKNVKEEEVARSSCTAESQPEEKTVAAAVEMTKDTKKDSRSKTKRIVESDSEEERMEKKKRKRIKRPEPDSSDEDVIPDSPQQIKTREPSPPPKQKVKSVSQSHPALPGTKTRKRRRVLKSRTFVDDEGCIVTEKGYESESYSESEDETQASKQASKVPVSEKLPAGYKGNKEDERKRQKKTPVNASKGTKQASIMGFFQKK